MRQGQLGKLGKLATFACLNRNSENPNWLQKHGVICLGYNFVPYPRYDLATKFIPWDTVGGCVYSYCYTGFEFHCLPDKRPRVSFIEP